jgi:hypothetical protein
MFDNILKTAFNKNTTSNSSWSPAHRDYITDEVLEDEIYKKGYAITGKLDDATLAKLMELYKSTHNFQKPSGGMFYSLYSRDIEYRTKVHEEIQGLLKPFYDSIFHEFRVVLNSFIVKVNGPESEFCLHQDSTSIDERKYSNLSVWIPLQDTDLSNGCLNIIPYSHHMFSPFRGISFAQPFEKIEGTLRRYLQPLILKAGDILLFDNRLVHNSAVNKSGKDRIVVMAGIYPKHIPIVTCYKDETSPCSLIEMIQQDDDFLITYPNFLVGCRCRPETGKSIGFVNWNNRQIEEKEFVAMCKKYNIEETNIPQLIEASEIQTGLDDPFAVE